LAGWRKDTGGSHDHSASETVMGDETDRNLVHELQKRDRNAWARTYDAHATDVFTFIAHLLHGDKRAAEEIHQDTWLAALAGIDAFDPGRGELRAWIFGIARRQVASHFRRHSQRRREENGGDVIAANSVDGESILPDDVIISIERGDAVRAALAELGADARGVLLGKYVDGQSVSKLAHRLGRSPKAIESLLSRARTRMRSLLRWYFDSEKTVLDERP
jgi:RNA polymerase sigma-70 factor, ECF subfamily